MAEIDKEAIEPSGIIGKEHGGVQNRLLIRKHIGEAKTGRIAGAVDPVRLKHRVVVQLNIGTQKRFQNAVAGEDDDRLPAGEDRHHRRLNGDLFGELPPSTRLPTVRPPPDE